MWKNNYVFPARLGPASIGPGAKLFQQREIHCFLWTGRLPEPLLMAAGEFFN